MIAENAGVSVQQILSAFIQGSAIDLTYTIAVAEEDQASKLQVEFSGPDSGMLLAENGKLLLALEHLAAMTLRLVQASTIASALTRTASRRSGSIVCRPKPSAPSEVHVRSGRRPIIARL